MQDRRFEVSSCKQGVRGALARLEGELASEAGVRRGIWHRAREQQHQRMRKGITHTCSDDDPDERYKFVIRNLKGTQGAPIIAGFRVGDSEQGAWVQQPPARVRSLGGQILAQVNHSNKRNVHLNAVHARHKVFVPWYPEVRAPGGVCVES